MNKNLFNNSNNNNKLKNNQNFNFKEKKNNTKKSLSEVESFLRDFHKFKKYIKLYKIIKK